MKILLLGGTGAMGSHLVEIAESRSVETYVTTRACYKSSEHVHYIRGNAQDRNFLESMLTKKWDAVIDFMVYSTTDFLHRVPLLLESTDQYVFLSSARVYANSEGPITEESPRLLDVSNDQDYLKTDEYALAKARQEDILRASGRRNWTIVRPYITYAHDRLQLGVLEKEDWLYRAMHGRTIVQLRDVHDRMTTMTSGSDVARVIMTLIGNVNTLGEAFHITAPHAHKWSYVLDVYVNNIKKIGGIAPDACFVGMSEFLRCHPRKYQVKYDRIYDRVFDNKKINRYYNTENFTAIEEGLRDSICKHIKYQTYRNINWKAEAYKDKMTFDKTSIREPDGMRNKAKYLVHRYFVN